MMADYNEAIKNLQTVHGMPMTIRLAIEALEKQIPQRVNYEFDGYYDGVPVYDIAECPCCGYKFYEGEHDWEMGVCPKCHQALDWECR